MTDPTPADPIPADPTEVGPVVVRRVLVANRGEIARRVLRTCRDLGLGTVAVHADADAASPHVAEADAAVRLPGEAPRDTYLRVDLVVDAAVRSGADAVHPGYGFLSENADLARAVGAAGLTWIGPSPESIEAMGSKVEAKRIMAAAGVPVLDDLDPDAIGEDDLPVLVKASAGGGGRGMRIVTRLSDLAGALADARAEAESAFGDPTVFCEPYVARGRHIEVQVLGDRHGTVWAVGERECSIQRRHQKIVEEAPSPLVERRPELRDRLFGAATAAATAIGYTGAGTVEFLVEERARGDGDPRIFFLEVNTRLQVEHPVTECTTGLDLVALQVQVAAGERLPSEPPPSIGHAIEARIYAEDPAAGWRPQSGTLHRFDVPAASVRFATSAEPAGVRVDSGVVDGAVIGTHYDPMLAKVIAWAPTRAEATRRLAAALRSGRIHGVTTNRELLVRLLDHPAFAAGDTDTAFLDRHGLTDLSRPLAEDRTRRLAALAAALADAAANRATATVVGGLPSGWRNIVSAPQRKAYQAGDETIEVTYRLGRDGLVAPLPAVVDGDEHADADRDADLALVSAGPDLVVLEVDGVRHPFAVARYPDVVHVDSALGPVTLAPVPRFTDPADAAAPGSLLAPMPGSILRVAVAAGDRVEAGQVLLWLEAMKMQHEVRAPTAGVVAELDVEPGRQVEVGAVLAVVRPHDVADPDDADGAGATDSAPAEEEMSP